MIRINYQMNNKKIINYNKIIWQNSKIKFKKMKNNSINNKIIYNSYKNKLI